MLKDHDSSAMVAVRDLDRARAFYGGTLGLELADEGDKEGVLIYRTGRTRLCVYVSEFAGTNRANAVVWGVGGDIDSIVAALEAKGADFLHYPTSGGSRAMCTGPGTRSSSGSRTRTETCFISTISDT